MPSYLVTWTIDIEADTPKEAAQKALNTQRDKRSYATIFDMKEWDHTTKAYKPDTLTIDLMDAD